MPRNRNKKRKAGHEAGNHHSNHHPNNQHQPNKKATPPNNKKASAPINSNNKFNNMKPSEIQAQPKFYLQMSKGLKCQPPYVSAVLLGLASNDDNRTDSWTVQELLNIVVKNCPNVMAEDASLFPKLLDRGDEEFLKQLCRASLLSNVSWNLDLAMLAVKKTPFLYPILPETLKQDNTTLAISAMMPATKDIAAKGEALRTIVKGVCRHCLNMFAQPSSSALQTILESDNEELVATVLIVFGERIGWDDDLAKFAKDHFPDSYSFFPAQYREDGVDAQKVMALLLPLEVTLEYSYEAMLAQVDAVVNDYPNFFRDRDAVELLFRNSNRIIPCRIVEKFSRQLPWDKDLTLLAARKCHDGDYHEDPNMEDEELERIYRDDKECKHHLPLGMLLSYVMVEAVNRDAGDEEEEEKDNEEEKDEEEEEENDDDDDWPDFMNHCRCALHQDDAVLWKVLDFVESILQRAELSHAIQAWLLRLCRQVRGNFQNQQSFQTFLKCITVSAEGGPLSLFRLDDSTSIGLKRHIAEFLGAPIQPEAAAAASLKRDALKLVYCLLTIPGEFQNDMNSVSDLYQYESPFRLGDGTFYCQWCCDALFELKEKYQDDENSISESESGDERDSESENEEEDEEDYSE